MQTLTTTTFVMQAILREINKKYEDLNFVYSTSLSYPFAEIQDRADDSDSFNVKPTSLPLLGFNRSSLRNSVLGSRGNRYSAYGSIPNTVSDAIQYRVAHCEFDFNFLLVDKDISTIESFEIDYMSKEGLGRITEFEVDFIPADLGFLKYYITWNPTLSDLNINTDENSFISIGGSATVRGFFVSLYGQAPLITHINLQLNDQFKEIQSIIIS